MTKLFQDILSLSIAERLELVQDIWDSIAEEPSSFVLSDAQKLELSRRRNEFLVNPDSAETFQQIRTTLGL